MPEQISIICPHCGFRKDVPAARIPAGAARAACPQCGQSFDLGSATHAAEARSPGETPPPPPPLPSAPAAPAPGATPRLLSFSFTGSARDYFGIWIVNTLLKLASLGVYTAWAKVRKRRFFYGSTTLHGQPFEYLADPLTLFKGWLIAAGAFVLYAVGSRVSPLLSGVIGLIVFAAFPWLVVRSRMFNAANSSHRNIRFGFRPDYSQAYLVYAALPFVSVLTLGLLFPYTLYRQRKFMTENTQYGASPFEFTATAKEFYALAFRVVLAFAGMAALIGGITAVSGYGTAAAAPHGSLSGMVVVPILALPLAYFIIMVYGQTALANLCWNATTLAGNRFRSTLRTRDMALLFVTNALAIMCSLGLLMPWATVRLMRYRFERLAILADGGLDGIVAAAGTGPGVSATGEEIGDVFGMPVDISL